MLYLIGNDLYSYRENETGVANVKVLFVEYKSVARRSQLVSGEGGVECRGRYNSYVTFVER